MTLKTTRFEIDCRQRRGRNNGASILTAIPRWQHKEPRCIAAKEKELNCWDEFDTYEEVKDEGQKSIGLVNLVLRRG